MNDAILRDILEHEKERNGVKDEAKGRNWHLHRLQQPAESQFHFFPSVEHAWILWLRQQQRGPRRLEGYHATGAALMMTGFTWFGGLRRPLGVVLAPGVCFLVKHFIDRGSLVAVATTTWRPCGLRVQGSERVVIVKMFV